jgi:hypothetical protein
MRRQAPCLGLEELGHPAGRVELVEGYLFRGLHRLLIRGQGAAEIAPSLLVSPCFPSRRPGSRALEGRDVLQREDRRLVGRGTDHGRSLLRLPFVSPMSRFAL